MATAHCVPPPPRVVELVLKMDLIEASILKMWMQNPLSPDESDREGALRQLIFETLRNRGIE